MLERLDLRHCRIEIIADIDDEQDGLLWRERVQGGIVNARRRSKDTKIGRTQNPGQAFPQQHIWPNKNGPNRDGRSPLHASPR
jgi:hypothetical protein